MNMEATPPERVTFLRRTTDITQRYINITLTGLLPTLQDYLSALTTGLPGIPEPPSQYMNSQ